MVQMTIIYDGELRCTARHGPSGSDFETDAPADNHGKAERVSPTDLVGAALGTCVATTLGIVAQQKGWDLKGLRVQVGKEISADAPRRISKLSLEMWMPIQLTGDDRAQVEKIAASNPVRRTLHPDVEIPVTIHWPKG